MKAVLLIKEQYKISYFVVISAQVVTLLHNDVVVTVTVIGGGL